ncbi:MAG TPA: rhodanese-like domain-containing protein [Actinobacteria bacterium]|nr:rhodanese-like domain-containing protein [Actinomycetota bacterium]
MGEFLSDNIWLILVLLFGSSYLWMRYGFYLRGIRQVNVKKASRMVEDEQALIVDVREKHEYAAAHIPGSRNLPMSQIRSNVKAIEKYRDRPLVVSCRSGSRSRRACMVLKKHGFSQVYNLKGGLVAWSKVSRSEVE